MPNKAIRNVIKAAGGPVKLSRTLAVTYAAVNGWERQGWLPLARAKEVLTLYPGSAELRDLVRDDLKAAMDLQAGSSLLK